MSKVARKGEKFIVTMSLEEAVVVQALLGGTTGDAAGNLFEELSDAVDQEIGSDKAADARYYANTLHSDGSGDEIVDDSRILEAAGL